DPSACISRCGACPAPRHAVPPPPRRAPRYVGPAAPEDGHRNREDIGAIGAPQPERSPATYRLAEFCAQPKSSLNHSTGESNIILARNGRELIRPGGFPRHRMCRSGMALAFRYDGLI